MTDLNKLGEWWYSKKIEDMPHEELVERIQQIIDLELARKIQLIPYKDLNPEIDERKIVEYNTTELVALCPATGYPDIYQLTIRYVPKDYIPELKSLKFYLMQYLKIPIAHEYLVQKIYRDFSDIVDPEHLYVALIANLRGGIETICQLGTPL